MSNYTSEQWVSAGEYAYRSAMAEYGMAPSKTGIAEARSAAVYIALGCLADDAAKVAIAARARAGTLSKPWRCRLGWHRWEMVMQRFPADSRCWFSRKCRRCGKQAKLP